MSKKFLVASIVLSLIGIITQWGLGSWEGILSLLIQIVFLAILVTILSRMIRGSILTLRWHILRNMLILGMIHGIFGVILLIFSVYNNLLPGAVGKIILSNQSGSIVFIQMSHIGTSDFYNTIHSDLQNLTQSGYSIYAEGVRPGSMKSQNDFDALIGVNMGSGLYDAFARLTGLHSQDESLYRGFTHSQLQNVDLSLDDMVSLIGTGASRKNPINLEAEFQDLAQERNAPFMGYIIRAFLNSMLRYDAFMSDIDLGLSPEVAEVILRKRNEHVVDTLIREKSASGVVLVYGALHFQGMYDLLLARDPSWHIDSIEPRYPYK